MKCSVCKKREVGPRAQRCALCYGYWKRTGEERPAHLIARQSKIAARRIHQPSQSVVRMLRRVAEILDS